MKIKIERSNKEKIPKEERTSSIRGQASKKNGAFGFYCLVALLLESTKLTAIDQHTTHEKVVVRK